MRTLFIACMSIIIVFSSFHPAKKSKLKLPDEFVKIPPGSFSLEKDSTRITVSEFYMSKYEVSNAQYRTFFSEVSANMTTEEKEKIACDSLGWSKVLTVNAPMKKFYYSQPAYNNYPVVNITYDGASKYCEWLQRKIQNSNPDFIITVKLPEKHQWIWAAMGGRSQAMFPWGNFYLRNRKGEFMCNFKRVMDQAIYRNRKTGKPEIDETTMFSQYTTFTADVKSFYPNDYKLYNMCGNAAEMVNDPGIAVGGSWNDYGADVKIRAESEFYGSAPTVGFRPVILVRSKNM